MPTDPSSTIGTSRIIEHAESIEHHLAHGCDERIYLDADGVNRYWMNPARYRDLVHRGSCTCGTLNDENVDLMDRLLSKDLTADNAYEELLRDQTAALKQFINYPGEDVFEIFYAPSGSDLAYFPILFSRILHPDRPVLNIVSCPEELGSGTLHAVKGEYHAAFNQFEEPVPKGSLIHPGMATEVLLLNARGQDGRIIDHESYIRDQVDRHPEYSVIVSLVYGSKSGIEDNLELIDKVRREDVIWSVDMCQFRHSRKIIHRLLQKNACIMITGSKFYQAPPFCGAMLVSRRFAESLSAGRLEELGMLDRLLSGYDLPAAVRDAVGLPKRKNIGLRLRWACSLNEMQQFRKIPRDAARAKVAEWNAFIMSRLERDPVFEPMPDQGVTNQTIISFRIKRNGSYMDHLELKALYKKVVTEGRLGGSDGRRVFIGQPVAYGAKSFLRVAIGSMCIREFIANDESEFTDDAAIIDLISAMAASTES